MTETVETKEVKEDDYLSIFYPVLETLIIKVTIEIAKTSSRV